MRLFTLYLLFFLWASGPLLGQYDPAAGQPGSLAMPHDDPRFQAWAVWAEVERGPQHCEQPQLGLASSGTVHSVLGPALNGQTLSLGDGGRITLFFEGILYDGPGPDFAVFENAFNNSFLELALVEVSSDWVNFVRFPAHSLTDTSQAVGSFGALQAENLYNLAGKYRSGFGTPFDLAELAGSPGLDINHIVAIRLIDVTGCLSCPCATRDSEGRLINDPYPTPFETGGFDLDALGLCHLRPLALDQTPKPQLASYPNPLRRGQNLQVQNTLLRFAPLQLELCNTLGQCQSFSVEQGQFSPPTELPSGTYLLRWLSQGLVVHQEILQILN